jgi:hypothetical protein
VNDDVLPRAWRIDIRGEGSVTYLSALNSGGELRLKDRAQQTIERDPFQVYHHQMKR